MIFDVRSDMRCKLAILALFQRCMESIIIGAGAQALVSPQMSSQPRTQLHKQKLIIHDGLHECVVSLNSLLTITKTATWPRAFCQGPGSRRLWKRPFFTPAGSERRCPETQKVEGEGTMKKATNRKKQKPNKHKIKGEKQQMKTK